MSNTHSPARRTMSSDRIVKKIQGLEEILESLREQLAQSRSENVQPKPKSKPTKKETKETKIGDGAATVVVAEEKEKDKIPMPWTGLVDFATCVGLKAQYGLFIQCGKTCDPNSRVFPIDNHDCRFCSECVKKCDEQGNHSVGTMEERIEAGVGKYVNAKTGKKETLYINALEKMNITKEEALASAEKRGFQIPDWMLEKAEKKRGRPAKNITEEGAAAGAAGAVETGSEAEKKLKQQIKKVKKTASVITTDTPQKTIPDSATDSATDSASLVDDNAEQVEKKKRGRPTKTITKKNVAESEMQQLIVQATAEKKKRLSFGPDLYTPLATAATSSVDHTNSDASEQPGIAANINFDAIADEEDEDDGFINFDNFGDEEEKEQKDQTDSQADVVIAAVAVAVVATVAPVVVTVEKLEKKKEKKEKVEKEKKEKVEKDKKEKVEKDKKEKVEKKDKKEKVEKKESEKKEKTEKKEKVEKVEKKESEKKEEVVVVQEEEEEELECEEYEYDGETYGLAPNGDIYSQDGDLVGKVTNGVTKMFS